MKRLNEAELNQKIDNFMSRKLAQHPDLQQADGIRAGKMWQTDIRLREVWRTFEGYGRKPLRQH